MSITAIGSTTPAPIARTPEVKEGPGPDRDHDGDDKNIGASGRAGVAATPQGMGAMVNSKA